MINLIVGIGIGTFFYTKNGQDIHECLNTQAENIFEVIFHKKNIGMARELINKFYLVPNILSNNNN